MRIGVVAVLRERERVLSLRLEIDVEGHLLATRGVGHLHGHGQDLSASHNSQSVVANAVERLHVARLAVHLRKSERGVIDGDIIVADLKGNQHALRASEDDVLVPSADTDIIHILTVTNLAASHILRNGGSSASEHVTILIQRHDHSVSHLRLLVEVGERERVQGLLKISLSLIAQIAST